MVVSQTQLALTPKIDWNSLYLTNLENVENYSTYILYEDRNDDNQFTANTILTSYLNDHITLNGSLNYSKLKSKKLDVLNDIIKYNSNYRND